MSEALAIFGDVLKTLIPALIAFLALHVTGDLSGYREFQKLALSRFDAISKMLDDLTASLCNFLATESFDAREKQKIEVQIASIQRDLLSLRKFGILGLGYIKPWNGFKRSVSLNQLDRSDFVGKNYLKIESVLAEREALDGFIKAEQIRVLNSRRRILEAIRQHPYCEMKKSE